MMHLVYFSQRSQLFEFFQNLSGPKKIMAPSPAKADGIRTGFKAGEDLDVVTISKFTSDILKSLGHEATEIPLKRKAELLLIFGFLKDRHLPELGFEQFMQAYNLFSDLRSFSLSIDALSTVLEEQSPEIQKAVQLFFTLMQITGNLDEHGAYHFIAEQLRSGEEKEELKKNYIFWGFQHLNGQQVDLLKALSIRYDVYLPFPLELKDKVKRTDWIYWLKDSKTIETLLPKVERSPKAHWIKVNSREISKTLRRLPSLPSQIVLGVSKTTESFIDYIPSRSVSFKIPILAVEAEILMLYDELKVQTESFRQIEHLRDFFVQKRAQLVKNNQSNHYRKLKAIELYIAALHFIREQTDEEIKVNYFFIKLLKEVVLLNQPRTSFVPVASAQKTIELKDMSSLEEVKHGKPVLFCLDERFDEIQGLGQNYTESIQKALSTLGPMKRPELELLFKQWEFHNILSDCDATILMSETILKHSLVWKKMFNGVDLMARELESQENDSQLKDHLLSAVVKKYEGSFSASKLQTYLDCPRKFYFNYVEKIFPQVSLEKDFDSLTAGSISHKIIEEFYLQNMQLEDLEKLTQKVMNDFINLQKVHLAQDKYLKHQLVFNHRAGNGIQFLKKIEEVLGQGIEWKNEKEFKLASPFALNGKIDCMAESGDIVFLLDFKSTKFSASTSKQVETFEGLQLWVYALASACEIKNFSHKSIVMGFISLDNPSESNLLFSDPALFEKFKAAKFSKAHLFKTPFPEIFKEAQTKIESVKKSIEEDTRFLANPKKLDVCKFCDLNKICIKSEMSLESIT